MRILIVEDEPGLRSALVDLVGAAGHEIEATGDGLQAVDLGSSGRFDLVILDVMIPGTDGIQVCNKLREVQPDLYILMLTAKGSEDDKVTGLRAGADDYVTKPFGAKELLARVESFDRRSQNGGGAETIEVDGCRLDLGRCAARRGEDEVTLTARETEILRLLYKHRARAVTRSELLEEVWRTPGDLPTRTVDMTISNLRQKIERQPSAPRIVITVKGVGYAWGSV